ncbi:hypothetical protein PGT21_018589 [Puccinia graminis f. sp. tritici]|uniref:Uncharacterized protein n=1 Tax=Puccinia graminis f. sp. tritici TaxID=56615 RepID=A0A5B0RKF4_PUCGR|nr:hypothetical protein PGT21_018589 [Puccinia graminis f. sp. tritici]KAA1125899.1 hypothetical protein PGTUg99_017590 [Puccinia graminis f. sp. tritici]
MALVVNAGLKELGLESPPPPKLKKAFLGSFPYSNKMPKITKEDKESNKGDNGKSECTEDEKENSDDDENDHDEDDDDDNDNGTEDEGENGKKNGKKDGKKDTNKFSSKANRNDSNDLNELNTTKSPALASGYKNLSKEQPEKI